MPPSSTISSKGQVTIPIEVRKRLGVHSGDRVEFIEKDGATVVQPAHPEENPFAKWVGVAPYFKNVEEINAWVADMRDDDVPYE
ncbi:AbrB/MazE/SpoVT family DNA-binding domain-containing protein [Granulicella sp. 5B5]|uniref:AbrB/MazE/SpoVT family DNA-binding domain-containing protein n=1 Tax=Granulicella sp. 5B5 TaxID=1617967 RepID=UPI0015F4324B|nr:AbrB/MazE/SpoVT family DNA-binding domain-containing protein [Granulicella sp. 5B5]QMV18868.1 AbrB/MazE/SpoVT family DNA-binding domain-containing protein [Granulicella sp. 5B5]